MSRFLTLALAVSVGGVIAGAAPATGPARSLHGVATRALSGDVMEVRLASGRIARVGVLGIDAPVDGACYGMEARRQATALAAGRPVTLTSATVGRAGGVRAYVALPRGRDLGRALVAAGAAQIDVWGPSFVRFPSYVPVQRAAEVAARGLWRACGADVDVVLSTTSQTVTVGEQLGYTVIVTNGGPLPAHNVSVDLRPPASVTILEARSDNGRCTVRSWRVTCSFGALADGGRATASVVVEPGAAGIVSTRASARFAWCLRAPCRGAALHDPNRRNDESAALAIAMTSPPPPPPGSPPAGPPGPPAAACHPSYPTVCIPPPPPDLDCADIPYRDFYVLRDPPEPDPHIFDGNEDGVGCQFDDY